MIAVDTNILVYANRPDTAWHAAAAAEIRKLAEGSTAWAIPWPCLHEFVGVVTNQKVYKTPTPIAGAIRQIEAWMDSPRLTLLSESHRAFQIFKDLALAARIAGGQTHDARIAALCIEHGVSELLTADRNFTRHPQLKTRNPLIA